MAKIILTIDDAVLSSALQEAGNRGQTVDAFVCEAIRLATADQATPIGTVDFETLLASLVERASKKMAGEEFYLDELTKPNEWNAINAGARKSLGKEFRKAIENPANPIARHAGRTSGNKAIYVRN